MSGQLVELFEDKVLIKREGLKAKMSGKGSKEVPIRQIASVDFWNATIFLNGYIRLVLGGQEAKTGFIKRLNDENTVIFNFKQRESFEALKQALEQRIADRQGPAEVPVEANEVAQPDSKKVAGGAAILSEKLRKLAEQNISEDESIDFCLLSPSNVGGWSQAIVALQDRLLMIKPGMAAGTTFGARVTSFYYRDITGIEVNTGLMQGVIEINTPAYQGTQEKDFWNQNKDRDPFKVTNCLPISKSRLKHYKPYIDRLRAAIREAKQERHTIPPPDQDGNALGSELEKLASLRDSGVLTEEEFQQAKRRVLSQ